MRCSKNIKKVDYTLQKLQQTRIPYTINKNALVCMENTFKNDDTNEDVDVDMEDVEDVEVHNVEMDVENTM